jgi:hypothetical protein
MNDHIANHNLIQTLVEVGGRISEQMGWGRGVDQLQETRGPADTKGSVTGKKAGVAPRIRRGV